MSTFAENDCCKCGQGRCAICGDACKSCAKARKSCDWADYVAADFLAIAASGITTSSQRQIAKRLRELVEVAGIDCAFDAIFPPPAASTPSTPTDAVTPCPGETKIARASSPAGALL